MERRYVCAACGMKWFDPLPELWRSEPTACAGCGGALVPLVGRPAPQWSPTVSVADDVGNGDA